MRLRMVLGIMASLMAGLAVSGHANAGYKDTLSGSRLVLDGAQCAGLQFDKGSNYAIWRNEMECVMDDSSFSYWRVIWLDTDDFALIEVERLNTTSPPRSMLYKVASVKGNKVELNDYWTGWGEGSVSKQGFKLVK